MRNDDFAIEQKVGGFQLERGVDQFGKITRKSLAGLGAKIDLAAVPGKQAAEAVPFGFVLPLLAARDGLHRSRFHRGHPRWSCFFLSGSRWHRNRTLRR